MVSEESIRDLEGALGRCQGQRDQERARTQELCDQLAQRQSEAGAALAELGEWLRGLERSAQESDRIEKELLAAGFELTERERALTERSDRYKAEAQSYAQHLGAAEEAAAALTGRHSDLARRHGSLVAAVEEHRRALGTPGWYAESLRLMWQAAGLAEDPEGLRLPPLAEYLSQCVRHWQELCGQGHQAEPPAVPPSGRGRNGVKGRSVASPA